MKIIQVDKQEVNYKDFIRRSAIETDYKTLIKEDCIIKHNDKIVCVYLHLHDIPPEVTLAIRKIKYTKNKRIVGLRTQSRIFGYMPREKIRKDFCGSTSLAVESPNEHQIICNFGAYLSKFYKLYAPEIFDEHQSIVVAKVKPEWLLLDSPFTSGIINKNNPLKYHHDRGNFKNVYSNMVAFKKDIQGGFLSFPEYNFALEIADTTLTFFDGQNILHGVTPIKYLSEKAYRFTAVYYTLQQMWQCLTPEEELNRIKRVKTEREIKRFKRLKGELPKVI